MRRCLPFGEAFFSKNVAYFLDFCFPSGYNGGKGEAPF